MKIGNLELLCPVSLAPMAGYTDRAMRSVCHELGADFSVTEMVSAKAVVYGDKKTFTLSRIYPDEGPVSLQIFGSEPEVMAEAAGILSTPREGVPPIAIDINMGCPVRKIFTNGEGSALMKSPELIEKIVASVTKATPLPVTVKLRAGIDEGRINAVECALAAESAGAYAVCIHGRTTKQMYSGTADRDIIAKVKSALRIPVIANGDITSVKSALEMLRYTDADGIAIGRGAVGNPFLFSEIKAALKNEPYTPPKAHDLTSLALRQLKIAIEDKGEYTAVTESRKQIALYLHAFRGAAALRAKINQSTTYREVEEILKSIPDPEDE